MTGNSYLLVDTAALAQNVSVLRSEVGEAELVAVLKGDAYGLGAVEVARVLLKNGVGHFAVSQVAEGLELRNAGIEVPIMVMSLPLFPQVYDGAAAGLTLTLGNFHQLDAFKEAADRLGHPIDVQLKLDTGLHRIGFTHEELPELIKTLRASAFLRICGTFSHFADSERTHMDAQFSLFCEMLAELTAAGIDPELRHISSSAPLEADTKYNMDAVRVGRRLYMDNPDNPTGRIREVASFRAYVTDIRARHAGDTLAYGSSVRLARDTTVGVISIGYGDGYPQELAKANAGVLIRGKRASLLTGCMDQSFVDLTGVDCAVGDEVTLFGYDRDGNFLSSQSVAALIGSNEGCGLTDALTHRVERVYL